MPTRTDEVSFAAFVAARRPMLQGIAFLMYGNLGLARTVVDVTMARLYDDWPVEEDPRDIALRRVLDARPSQVDVPWDRPIRVELVDSATPGTAPPMGIVADLAALDLDERRVLILQHFAHVPLPRIPPLVDRTLSEVQQLARSARHQLIAADRDRAHDDVLAAQLAEVIPYDLREGLSADVDIAHGKQLIRQRMFRRLAVAMAAVLVLVGVVIWAPREPLSASTSPPAPTSIPVQPRPRPPCAMSDNGCQVDVLGTWRAQMADVVTSYLDPEKSYFDGVGHGSEPIYETPSFWDGRGGVLGFDLFSRGPGATLVYVQVASDRSLAIRCGDLTGQRCVSQRFLDGNRFSLTETTYAAQGVEVQFAPNGTEVVTVVARNTTKGRALDISRGDLIKVVQDSRLRLPHG
jgi:hypothetical protein